MGLTVFHEGRRGSASTAGLDRAAVERLVEEAMLIARKVQPDPEPICPGGKPGLCGAHAAALRRQPA
ncbi:PmbA/TldA family metallopeptidase [Caulobacter segnis]